MDILTILITAAVILALGIVYFKFIKKKDSSQYVDEIKDKEHELDLIKLQHESDLKILNEKLIITKTTTPTIAIVLYCLAR